MLLPLKAIAWPDCSEKGSFITNISTAEKKNRKQNSLQFNYFIKVPRITLDLQEHNRTEWIQAIQRICRERCKTENMKGEDSRKNISIK